MVRLVLFCHRFIKSNVILVMRHHRTLQHFRASSAPLVRSEVPFPLRSAGARAPIPCQQHDVRRSPRRPRSIRLGPQRSVPASPWYRPAKSRAGIQTGFPKRATFYLGGGQDCGPFGPPQSGAHPPHKREHVQKTGGFDFRQER